MADEVETGEPQGTFACPICGVDVPHHHTDEQVLAYHKDQMRNDGWTNPAHRQPNKSGWYLCIGVEVDSDQFGEKKDFWTPNERWSQLWWFNWVREAGATYPARDIQEVLYFEHNHALGPFWRLRNYLGNAVPSGAESRFPVHAKPKFWRDLPGRQTEG